MEDRALLELAAKAAGMEVLSEKPWPNGNDGWFFNQVGDQPPALYHRKNLVRWAPLDDDGDNRRLQVALRLGLVPLEGGGWDCYSYTDAGEKMLATDMDPNRAVVLAAAAIGKEM